MLKDQYIDSLIDQGFSKEEIKQKIANFEEPTDPPKKTSGSTTVETSVEPNVDMVSNLEDGSLGLQALTSQLELDQEVKPKKPKQLITELEVPDGVNPEEFRKRMEEAYAGISDFERIEEVKIKAKPTIPLEAVSSKSGVSIWGEGDYDQLYLNYDFIKNNTTGNINFIEADFIKDRQNQKKSFETPGSGKYNPDINFLNYEYGQNVFNDEFDADEDITGLSTSDSMLGKFFRGASDFISDAVLGDRGPVVFRQKYFNRVEKGQDIGLVSFNGERSEIADDIKKVDDLSIYDPVTDRSTGGNFRTINIPKLRNQRANLLTQKEYLLQSNKYKTEDSYIQHVYSSADDFLTREELEYKSLKDRYNSTTKAEEKKDIRMKLDALDFGQDLFDEKGKLINYEKEPAGKVNEEQLLVQKEVGKILKQETDEDILKRNLATSHSRLIALGKDIKKFSELAQEKGLIKKNIRNISGDPTTYLSGFLGDINKALEMANSGEVPADIKLLGGNHPLAKAFNDALVEFKALNKAIKLNIDPIKDDVEIGKNFVNGLLELADNRLGDVKVPDLTTSRDQALAIDRILKSNGYDTESKSHIIEKDNIWNNTFREFPSFAATLVEFGMYRGIGGGIGLRLENSIKATNTLRKANPILNFGSKLVNNSLNVGKRSIAEGLTFAEVEILKGNYDNTSSNFSMGTSLGLVGGITKPIGTYATKAFFNNQIGRAAYKYNSARFLTSNAISSTVGGSQFVIADALSNSEEYKKSDGSVNWEKIKEKTITEAFKFSMYNSLPGVGKPGWAKDFAYRLNADVKEMFNTPSKELEKASNDFGISLNDINKNKKGIQQEIESKRLELIEGKSEEEVETINNQALTLTNQSDVALYNQYVNPRKEFTDREIFETGFNLISGKKLNARQSEIASQVPSAVIYEFVKSTDNRSANETIQYLDNQQKKYELIEANLNHNPNFKTSWRTERQRTKVASVLNEILDLESEKSRLQGKEKSIRTQEENSRILDLELQIDQAYKDAKYISDKAFEDGFKKINKQAGRIGKEKIVVLSDKDFNIKAEEITGEKLSEKDGTLGFFDGETNTRYINEDVSRATKTITTAIHETGHFILKDSLRDKTTGKVSEEGIRIIDEVLNELNESQRAIVQERIDNNYRFDEEGKENPKEEYYEEYLTVLSEEIADKNITFKKNIGEALLDLVPFMRKNGLPGLEMSNNTGKELFNLISSYSTGKAAGIKKAKELAQETPEGKGIAMSKKAKSTILEEINKLIPENIETKEQFLSDRSFTKVYESAMSPGGAINNYVKSRTSSAMEAELAVDSVLERLMNFDPQAKRKDGSRIGREGFGEFIFANTAFGKLDAKKKLFQESERRSKETSIDESTKQIADVETVEEVEAEVKEKPTINPLKFVGVPSDIKLSDEPGKGLTFKKVAKQYAGEVGEQAIGIPAKKITESAANLGSVNEARSIQQFFFKADNLDKFVKILPEYNIAIPETKVGLETLDVPKDVSGTGLGLPKRMLDYFYEDFIDPTGKLTSPKGRSKGLTSQTAVKRLKPEFRGTVSKETIDKIKKDIGITPKGELNILPKGELRSPIGQLLKGMAKTYSTLAANTLVRQRMTEVTTSKEDIARVAGGKRDVMLSKKKKIQKELGSTRTIKDVYSVLKQNGVDLKDINTDKELDIIHSEIEEIIKSAGITLEMFRSAKFTNFGVKTVYGEFDKNGNFKEFSKKEKESKGKDKLKFKYYELKNNEFIKVPIKKNETGNLVEDKQKANEIKESRSGDFTPDRSDLYYGTDDPAYKKAEDLARQNTELEAKKPKRVSVKKAGTKEANEQFAINLDVLEDMTIKLADAVNNKKLSADAAVKFITKAYQATSGIIKISAPFKYKTINPKYAGEYGKPEQNKGELIREEHTVPASVIGGYLIHGILTNTAKEAMSAVRKNFFQIALGKQYDVILDKAKLDATLAEGSSLFDENIGAIRMLTANILTENIKDLPRMNFNDIANIETNESWAKEIGVTLPKEYQTIDNLNLQNRLLLDKIKGEGKYTNHQEYINEYIKLEATKAAEANQNRLKGVATSFSKKKDLSNKKILNDLSNRDKALRNARNAKAPIKGISVFDFDDTLATTKSMVGVTMPDGTETKIDATEFAKTGEDLLEQGATFDFSDFSKVVGGEPGPLIAKLDKAIKKFGNKDVFVLTARPANSASAIYEFLKGLGYEIPLENITGLANSSPEAKAQWMIEKAAEGYNDFYFTDDAYKNVKAVQDAMSVLDVKSKERIVYKDIYDKMDKEFNDILEANSGIASEKVYSKAKAEVVGASQGKFKWFIPPSADDFVGLLYSTLAKGKLGDAQMAWYKKNLLDPYARAMNAISSERVSLAADYKALKKKLGIVPKNLRKKIEGEGFTKEQAIRMYIWNKQGMDIPGLSKSDLADMVKYVESDASLQVFADQLIEINKGDGYPEPKDYWLAGSITTDLMDGLGGTKRAKHLEEWQQNVDAIFSEKNLNKLQAIHGKPYREALENMLQRMKSGKNRNYAGDSTTGRMMDWLNGSIGAIMFLNTRSAVLQTLSAVNFINFKDNNILAAGKAFANQPQYWKDFKELFNSDFLKERRDNAAITINESDIADMANKGGAKGAISYLLQKGFTPTQIADSFAIASGGATFYRNRIKTYMKEGMSETEAKEKAFVDFRETAEESQQSSRPDRISKQQAGPLGRVVLAFANTPSQYARIIKKASQDLMAGRGDTKTNISKIIYYGAIQGFIFNAVQQALFAADLDDEDEKTEKMIRLGNGMADGVIRGMGVSGAAVTVVKNASLRVYNESQKDRPKYEKVAFELTKLSPPIASKLSRINQAAREVQWNLDEMKQKGFSLDNPAWLAAGNVISATTNIPLDRVIKKVNNVNDALSQDLEMQERIALLAGWQSWELGIDEKEKDKKSRGRSYKRSSGERTYIQRTRN